MKAKETKTWIPLTLQASLDSIPIVVKAEGEFFWDKTGQRYIDGISSWWTVIHGHRHPKIMEAIKDQTSKLDHFMMGGFLNEEAEALSEELLQITSTRFGKVFYSDNGSNAVEIGLKIAVQFFENKGGLKDRERKSFINFSASYHGDSIGGMSVSGPSYFNRIFKDLQFEVQTFPAPNCFDCPFFKKPETCKVECLEAVQTLISKSPERFAGIVVEPLVFGAAGMKFYDKKVLDKLAEIRKQYEILLIFDEVFTGLGKTGEQFAFQHSQVIPDILAIAKGLTGGTLPLGATLVTSQVYEAFDSIDPMKAFFHAHTMTGNALACRAGIASLQVLQSETFAQINGLSEQLNLLGNQLKSYHPSLIRDNRTLGSIFAFEVNSSEIAEDEYLKPIGKRVAKDLWERGVYLRPLGNTIYICPPYNIKKDSLELIFDSLRIALDRL